MHRIAIFLALALCLLPLEAMAEDRPRAGLMWNRSGLPATFPLQVRTFPGKDYVLFLSDPETLEPAMAGYIRGGEHFRLLVPPGEWQLRFAFGQGWLGEQDLFGPLTGWVETDAPLEFRITGLARRDGYLVTLIEENGAMKLVDAMAQPWCQITDWEIRRRVWPEDADERLQLRYLDFDFDSYTRLCV